MAANVRDGAEARPLRDEAPVDPQDRIRALEQRLAEVEGERDAALSALSAVRASESRIRLIADSTPALIAYFDAERRCRYVNRTWQTWFGAVPLDAAIAGLPDLAVVASAVDRALAGQPVENGEVDLPCLGGETDGSVEGGGLRRVALSCTPHMDPGGRVIGIFLLGLDVTERWRAEAALRDRDELLNLAMRGPNEGLWDWNPATKVLFLSARLLSILGFESDTVRTTTHEWLKIVHPDDRNHYQTLVRQHLQGHSNHFECEYRVADNLGNWRWVLARGLALRGPDGRSQRMVGSIGDITAMKQREIALRSSEQRFRSLLQTAASIILVLDANGCLQVMNREAERAFGIAAGEALGLPWSRLIAEGPGGPFAARLAAAVSGQRIRNFEQTGRDPSGAERVVLWNLNRLADAEGTVEAVVCVGQDITRRKHAELALRRAHGELERNVADRTRALTQEVQERRRAEAELLQAKDQAVLANRTKSEFLANMSHELRTPLNAIIGFSTMMESELVGPLGSPKYKDYASVICKSGEHLLAVINDILDVAKIEAGKFEIHPQPVDVRDCVDSSVLLIRERAAEQGVDLRTRIAEDTPFLLADPVRVKQILLNLLSNAVKFTPEGGSVSLSVHRDPDGRGVSIEVADTGIGMDARGLTLAMQPFGQVDSQMLRRGGGTGLGLPLVRSFVDLHGGSMDIESAQGAGTTVRVRLPAAPDNS